MAELLNYVTDFDPPFRRFPTIMKKRLGCV